MGIANAAEVGYLLHALYTFWYNTEMYNDTNPFTFGALALDKSFTDREDELKELAVDIRNGQDVLVFAPRRYGKSSLVLRAAQEALAKGVLVAYCDLMKTPTKERFAGALAKTIYEDLVSPVGQALEKAATLFRGLRIKPTIEIDPDDASLRFSFEAGRARAAGIDDTIEKLPGRSTWRRCGRPQRCRRSSRRRSHGTA